MLDAAPKHDTSEQPSPLLTHIFTSNPEDSSGEHPEVEADCSIDLPGVTPADDCEKNVATTKEDSDHELLHQLSASAIEACRGTDLAEPRCYLHALGFKSEEMETAYMAAHSQTTLTGHKIFAVVNALYLLVRIVNLLRGDYVLEPDAMTSYFLCTLGVVAVLSAFCVIYFSGQEVRLRQSLARASIGIFLLSSSGWIAQCTSALFFQADVHEDNADTFLMSYLLGVLSSILPLFCLVMLRIPFLVCALLHPVINVLILCCPYAAKIEFIYVTVPLLQVPERHPPNTGCLIDLCQILMMYSVEKASRSTFLGEVQSAKRIADIQQAASDAEASGESLLL